MLHLKCRLTEFFVVPVLVLGNRPGIGLAITAALLHNGYSLNGVSGLGLTSVAAAVVLGSRLGLGPVTTVALQDNG